MDDFDDKLVFKVLADMAKERYNKDLFFDYDNKSCTIKSGDTIVGVLNLDDLTIEGIGLCNG